jgi:hypothetical protein
MGVISTVPVLDGEFWAVVLADPDLLDEAFAEVMASWHAGLPWRSLPRQVPRPRVARSPPP